MTRRICGVILFLLLMACEDAYQGATPTRAVNLIVVDGMITSESTNHVVRLSFTHQNLNDEAVPVTGASVTITVDNTTSPLTETPGNSGIYLTPVMRAVTGKYYTLNIIYDGKTYSATDSPVPVDAPSPVSFTKADSGYHLNAPATSSSYYNYTRYLVDWQNTPNCATTTCVGEQIFYDLKSIDVNDIFKPGKDEFDFPSGAVIYRTRFSASEAYRNFLRSMLSETEWHGGVFDIQRANVTTNVSGGAVGFFATSTIVRDTTSVP